MKNNNNKYHTVGTVSKLNNKIIEREAKSIHLTHKYMTVCLQSSNLFVESKTI
jgi:hypothetical protein